MHRQLCILFATPVSSSRLAFSRQRPSSKAPPILLSHAHAKAGAQAMQRHEYADEVSDRDKLHSLHDVTNLRSIVEALPVMTQLWTLSNL